MESTNPVTLILGGNRGDVMSTIFKALDLLAYDVGPIIKRSGFYETAPWGFSDQNNFVNLVAELETSLRPRQLLSRILAIEQDLGRIRQKSEGYSGRTIDIDILFYGDAIINEDGLIIPHPRMKERRFVLVPLEEVSPEKVHPVLKKTVNQMLNDCSDQLEVKRL